MLEMKIFFQLKGAFRDDATAGGVISYCPALNVFSHGKTKEEAKEALCNALTLFLETCYQRDTLWNILRKAGFTPLPRQAGVAVAVTKQDEHIEIHDGNIQGKFSEPFELMVPVNLVAQAQQEAECQHV
jgi:predicted RNase H-like HicB family nuclease